MSETLTEEVLEKPKMGAYKRHLLICVGPRCTEEGESQELFEMLARQAKLGVPCRVKVPVR